MISFLHILLSFLNRNEPPRKKSENNQNLNEEIEYENLSTKEEVSKGIFDKETARKFKTYILEKGGTEKPMKLYKLFRGKKPDNTALLKRAGLLK